MSEISDKAYKIVMAYLNDQLPFDEAMRRLKLLKATQPSNTKEDK